MGAIYFTSPESEFGWITEDRNMGGPDLFVHKTDIMNPTPPPERGDRVSYTVGEGTEWNRGKPVARNAHIERLGENRQGTDGRPGSSSGDVRLRERSRSNSPRRRDHSEPGAAPRSKAHSGAPRSKAGTHRRVPPTIPTPVGIVEEEDPGEPPWSWIVF